MSEYEVFFINGTSKKSSLEEYLSYLYEDKDYQILVNNSKPMNKFICYNDEVFNEVMLEAGSLFRFIENFFIKEDELDSYNLLYLMCQCGLDSDISFKNKNDYIELINNVNHSAKYKFLYVSDILFLINSLLNLIEEIRISFIQFYIVINDIELYSNLNNFYEDEHVYFYTGYISSIVTLYAGAVFIKANSILDILTKIMFEIKNKETNFLTYKKLNSHNKQYGDINRLDLKQVEKTLFEKTKFITEIISIRNEIIHNGSWDFNPKIFFSIKSNKIIERFMLFPDMEDGHLASFKNRNHFFSEQNKLNLKLDYYYSNFMKLLLNTIKYMLK